MPRRLYTTDDLISQVRSLIDEENRDSVSDTQDILPALNRGLDYGANILSRKYTDPFLANQDVQLSGQDNTYPIPEDCFEDKVLKVTILLGSGIEQEVKRVSYYDAARQKSNAQVSIPSAYYVQGRDIVFVPNVASGYQARIYYFRQPEELVISQGRITNISTQNNYLVVDNVGPDLTTESDKLNSYINIIDNRTGIVKWTGQIQVIDDNRISIRSTPQRTTVLGRTILTSFPDNNAEVQVELDDLVCTVHGTCVPYFQQPLANFLIQYAVAEITRKLGGEAGLEEQVLQKFEKHLEFAWSGKENTRIKQNRSRAWANGRVRTIFGR